jgi:iron complex outermembrane receptor protein
LITPALDESAYLGFTYVNQGQVRAKGLELEAQVRLKGDSRALVSYGFQNAVDQQTGEGLPNSPHHVAKARFSLPGPTPRSIVSFEGQYLSSRTTLARDTRADGFTFSGRVSDSFTLNVNFIQPLGRSWQLFGGVRNLFDTEYADPVSIQHEQESIPQNGITARIGLTWKLWQR